MHMKRSRVLTMQAMMADGSACVHATHSSPYYTAHANNMSACDTALRTRVIWGKKRSGTYPVHRGEEEGDGHGVGTRGEGVPLLNLSNFSLWTDWLYHTAFVRSMPCDEVDVTDASMRSAICIA